ncbi:phosphotransferase family protein [Variovorax sp. dw_954]|uniref:phosphotransferase family protein n=1 Tax=Variovorax sp. dw_954 TaxID=2720078 RepID=UPI001BD3625B|nr:phosphotransferase family protein [Variovorax sp. dw_954]
MKDDALCKRIEAYLSAQVRAPVRASGLKRFPVGFSWATYAVEVEADPVAALPAASMILRMGPDDALYSPYSAVPQHQLLTALARSSVPTPRVYWHSDDRRILGAPFFFCERVGGRAPLPSVGAPDDPVPGHRETMAAQFVGALADLHGFGWQSAPELGEWGRGLTPENTALRQVEVCEQDYERWATRPQPAMLWAMHWLRRTAPRAQRLAIVHADYRIGNFLFDGGRITAVLDWESAHLGDPHEDLAWATLPQFGGGTGLVCRLMDLKSFLALYERLSGHCVDLAALRYYTVMSLLKLAQVYLASAHTFERPGASDVRMGAMATQAAQTLRQMQKNIEATA